MALSPVVGPPGVNLAPNAVLSTPTPPVANPRPQMKADPRFRSFVERYVIERAAFFRTDPEGHMEDQWQCILDAKRVYALINRVGQGAAEEDSEGF